MRQLSAVPQHVARQLSATELRALWRQLGAAQAAGDAASSGSCWLRLSCTQAHCVLGGGWQRLRYGSSSPQGGCFARHGASPPASQRRPHLLFVHLYHSSFFLS